MAMGTIKFPDTDGSLYGLNPLQCLVTDAEHLAGGWAHRTGKRPEGIWVGHQQHWSQAHPHMACSHH